MRFLVSILFFCILSFNLLFSQDTQAFIQLTVLDKRTGEGVNNVQATFKTDKDSVFSKISHGKGTVSVYLNHNATQQLSFSHQLYNTH